MKPIKKKPSFYDILTWHNDDIEALTATLHDLADYMEENGFRFIELVNVKPEGDEVNTRFEFRKGGA